MNYYIEKHDMNIILDALEHLHQTMKTRELFGLEIDHWAYTKEDVDSLFQSIDNSFTTNT